MKPSPATLLFLVLAAASAPSAAQNHSAQEILQQQREIRDQTREATGAYSRFSGDSKSRLRSSQDIVFQLLEDGTRIEALRPEQKVELFNALEHVKAIIAANEADRQECWRERKLGSSMKHTRCATLAELDQVRRDAREWKGDPSVCGQTGAGFECGNMGGGM